MKILYITNICNVGPILVEEAAHRGIEAYFVEYPWAVRKFTNFFRFLSFFMRHRFLDFDIYHYNWPIDTLLSGNRDITFLKNRNKKVFVYYHGSDIRNRKEKESLKHVDGKCVSTPDLLEFLPDAEWVPFPYNIRDMTPRHGWNDPIKIVHSPSRREKKGTFHILKAIRELKKDYTIEFELIEGKTNRYVLETMKKSDIVIDQIGPGWYGKVTIEALYCGAVPCFYVRPDLLQYIPVKFFANITKETITDVIGSLIGDEHLRNTLRKNGYQYIKRHDSRKIMDKLISMYIR